MQVENSKGEAGIGQHELNVQYTDILHMVRVLESTKKLSGSRALHFVTCT